MKVYITLIFIFLFLLTGCYSADRITSETVMIGTIVCLAGGGDFLTSDGIVISESKNIKILDGQRGTVVYSGSYKIREYGYIYDQYFVDVDFGQNVELRFLLGTWGTPQSAYRLRVWQARIDGVDYPIDDEKRHITWYIKSCK
jgi:hypothetical protein